MNFSARSELLNGLEARSDLTRELIKDPHMTYSARSELLNGLEVRSELTPELIKDPHMTYFRPHPGAQPPGHSHPIAYLLIHATNTTRAPCTSYFYYLQASLQPIHALSVLVMKG